MHGEFFYFLLYSLLTIFFCFSDELDAPMVLAPQGQRVAVAGGLVAVGLGVAAAMCTYPWRYIDKLILLKGGERVKLITHAKWIKSHQVKTYPLENIRCKQKVFTGVGKIENDTRIYTMITYVKSFNINDIPFFFSFFSFFW